MNPDSLKAQSRSEQAHPASGDCQGITLACPRCKTPLYRVGANQLQCANHAGCPEAGTVFQRSQGIWRFLLPDRAAHFQQFLRDYESIRQAEGRGGAGPEFYRSLPYTQIGSPFHIDWQMRLQSYTTFITQLLEPRERQATQSLKILDLGAGNGWLSNRLSLRGHNLTAVDLVVNSFDGLGAHILYDQRFIPVQAEYEYLPLAEAQYDLAIFNASLHYAERYEAALAEALRTLIPGGALVIMDTPFYRNPASGEQMVRERASQFRQTYGTASDSLASENFLTPGRLIELAETLHLQWQRIFPRLRLRHQLKRWLSGLRAGREPARFPILWAAKSGHSGDKA